MHLSLIVSIEMYMRLHHRVLYVVGVNFNLCMKHKQLMQNDAYCWLGSGVHILTY